MGKHFLAPSWHQFSPVIFNFMIGISDHLSWGWIVHLSLLHNFKLKLLCRKEKKIKNKPWMLHSLNIRFSSPCVCARWHYTASDDNKHEKYSQCMSRDNWGWICQGGCSGGKGWKFKLGEKMKFHSSGVKLVVWGYSPGSHRTDAVQLGKGESLVGTS